MYKTSEKKIKKSSYSRGANDTKKKKIDQISFTSGQVSVTLYGKFRETICVSTLNAIHSIRDEIFQLRFDSNKSDCIEHYVIICGYYR